MRISGLWTASVLLSCFTCWGCGDGSAPSGGTSAGEAAGLQPNSGEGVPSQNTEWEAGQRSQNASDGVTATDSAHEAASAGLAGRWLVNIGLMWPEISQLWIVEVTGEEGAYEPKVVESAVRSKVQIRGLEQEDDRVHFQLAIDDQDWQFDGVLLAGRVQGVVELRDRVSLTWLERTKLRSLPNAQASASPQGMAEFAAAQQHEEPKEVVRGMIQFVDRNTTSPLVFDALRTVVKLAKVAELSEEELRGVVTKYEELSTPWGVRWRENTIENIAYDLATAEGAPDAAIDAMALEYAESAKAALPESASRPRRQSIELAYAVALVNSDRAEEGKKLMDELAADSPDQGELRFRSALAAEKLGDLDGAIESLLSLWPHPLATRELERIWKGEHGDLSGLDERLDGAYLKRFPPLATTPYTGREDPASNQVALVELFTGTGCPPCVAADVAFESLGRTFTTSDLVLLQYHLHVPSPDPLTNPDSEERASYYKVSGTPFILVSGKESVRGGGPRQRAPDLLSEYRSAVELQLKQKSLAKIDLSAKRDDGQVAIDVKLSDVEPNDTLRLRLAVVEDTVRFTGLNGVRLHHSVVRGMPGGAAGIAVSEAELTVHANVRVSELRDSIEAYLADFEKQFSQDKNIGFEFPTNPLDLAHLGVAAFLQNDETQEVIQAAFVQLGP